MILEKKIVSSTCQFPNLKTKEDFVLWLLILKKGFKIGALKKSLTLWMKLDNFLSAPVVDQGIKAFAESASNSLVKKENDPNEFVSLKYDWCL